MWPSEFRNRLPDWVSLRDSIRDDDFQSSLLKVNDWWFQSPITHHYLHWDDYQSWPSPWDLLADNIYCDIARALGMLYTVAMTDVGSQHKLEIAKTKDENLVLVDGGKYILNWAPGHLLNIQSANISILRSISSDQLNHLVT
jgi:hypothetical protein